MNPNVLYRDYKSSMMKVCGRLVKNKWDAEEIVHDAFTKIFQKWDTFDKSKGSPYTWMRIITLNTTISFLRHRALGFRELTEEHEEYIYPSVCFNQETYLAYLMPATAAVFRLYAIEGYSHKEIGNILDISEGTSKWHFSEAKRNLRKIIKL